MATKGPTALTLEIDRDQTATGLTPAMTVFLIGRLGKTWTSLRNIRDAFATLLG
jgi:hypothetical protein